MIHGCESFLVGWEEEMELALINRVGNDLVENEFCLKKSYACIGVDLGNVPKIPEYVTVDGKKAPIGK